MRKNRRIPTRVLVAVGVCVAGAAFGFGLAVSSGAEGGGKPLGREGFGVFDTGPSAAIEPELVSLGEDVGVDAKDKSQFRVLGTGLGQWNSRLVAFPARGGQNVCYSLLAAKPTDPGMSRCYQPRGDNLPAELAGKRFSVVAPQALIDGVKSTQVFGVAENNVKSVRVMVAGSWRDAQMLKNGFFLDLPGVPTSDVSTVEATLANGSTQAYVIRSAE